MPWRTMFAALLAAWIGAATAATGTNLTDHWWNPAESGWGLSVTQQDDVAFVAMFVYGPDGAPTWLTATATRYATDPAGHPGFAGPLYRSSGPSYASPAYDPGQVAIAPVGTLTLESTGPATAILAYTVDGARVVKTVQRLTFRQKNWSGIYRAVQRASHRDCTAGYTPPFVYDDGLVDVEHEGSRFRMWFEGRKATCTYTGTYAQQGRIGTVSGTYVCADGPGGTFALRGLETHENAFGAYIEATHPSCGYVRHELAGFSLD